MTADRVLFDAPGPRARRRIRVFTVVSVLLFVLLVAVALRQFGQHGQLAADRWTPFTQTSYLKFLWQGLEGTLAATAMSALLAFPAGALLALLRLSLSRPVRWLATAYIELFRSVPLLLLLYAFLLALPGYGVNLPIFWKLVVPIVMVNAAVLAEIFRAGVLGLDRGQAEAASAIGLRYWPSMRLVVLPQAVRLVLPTLVAQLVNLLKDSTLGYIVSYPELMKQGNDLTVYTHLLIQAYLIIAVLYVILNFALSQLANLVERRMRRRRIQGRVAPIAGAADPVALDAPVA
ncbi:amino acid ABC transporter permease [Amycolatopsis sp. H20-H5]|uniref:amino acid ABC transporter permease n=1 Tax=Amycolatopsis sp. H20-H5 TaxID=3046309 RepID=UPI002DBF37CD|nr:amino acid ABC transporter permease [Amycolatopsis sp. H20-H5]MEC3976609.1 amino acid ABC transporter permease [Amycolatopsis sp. H20-H5]